MAYNPGGSHRGGGDPRFGGGGRSGGRSFGGGGGYGGGRGGDRGSRGPMEMHQATCADCGKSCEVPFRPSGTKPVYCSNCFKSKDKDNGGGRSDRGGDFGGGSGSDFERRDNGARRSYGDRDFSERPPMQMHEAVCSECGKDCEVPFKPSSEKPVYCNDCFDKVPKPERKGKDSKGSADFNAKFEMLNIKLDRILKALDSTASSKSNKEVKEVVKEVKEITFEAPKKAAKEAKKVIPTETKSVIKKAKPKVKKAKI
jgi:CxxC-x17-CxxC domain-containing protein